MSLDLDIQISTTRDLPHPHHSSGGSFVFDTSTEPKKDLGPFQPPPKTFGGFTETKRCDLRPLLHSLLHNIVLLTV